MTTDRSSCACNKEFIGLIVSIFSVWQLEQYSSILSIITSIDRIKVEVHTLYLTNSVS